MNKTQTTIIKTTTGVLAVAALSFGITATAGSSDKAPAPAMETASVYLKAPANAPTTTTTAAPTASTTVRRTTTSTTAAPEGMSATTTPNMPPEPVVYQERIPEAENPRDPDRFEHMPKVKVIRGEDYNLPGETNGTEESEQPTVGE